MQEVTRFIKKKITITTTKNNNNRTTKTAQNFYFKDRI